MLSFEKTLLIGSLLDLFVANIGGREGGNLLQQTSCDITNFVVVDAGVTSSRTRQCVGHSELAATGARGGQTLQVPVVPEVQSIAEFCLGEGEAVAHHVCI